MQYLSPAPEHCPAFPRSLSWTEEKYRAVWKEIGRRSEQLDRTEQEDTTEPVPPEEQAPGDLSLVGYLLNENLSEPFVGMPKLMLDFDANPARQTEVKDMAWGSSVYLLLVLRHFQSRAAPTVQLKRLARHNAESLLRQFGSKVHELEAMHKEKGYPFAPNEVRERLVLVNHRTEHLFCEKANLRDHLLSLPQESFRQALTLFGAWLLALERPDSSPQHARRGARAALWATQLCTALEKLVRWYVFLLGRQLLLQTTRGVGIAVSLEAQASFWSSTARELDMSWSEVVNSKFASAVYASELLPGSKLYFRMLYGNTSLRLHQAVVAQKTLAKAEFMALQQIGRTKDLQALWIWNHTELPLSFSSKATEKGRGGEAKSAVSAQGKDMQNIHFRKIGCADLLDVALICKSFEDLLDQDAVPSVFCLPFYEMAQHTQTGAKKGNLQDKTFVHAHTILRVTGGWMVVSSDFARALPFRAGSALQEKEQPSIFCVRLVEAYIIWLALTEKADPALFSRIRKTVGVSDVHRFLEPLRDAIKGRL